MPAHGRYNLLSKIADGGTAEVFLAHLEGSAGFKRLVVLKRVRPTLWADEEFRRMLVDEAHIAMGLHHSNIVQVIDLGVSADRYFLAFELVDGWTLSQVIKRARAAEVPIPLNLALHIMAEVCRALAYAHGRSEQGVPLAIVHRDVSPQNVLISEQGEVKLTDFGIARARTRASTSRIGSVKGKPAYMSPEQASGGVLDARSDLFPIGTMIYQLATGALPFTAPSALEEMAKVLAAKFVDPATLRPDLPAELVQLINKALERKVDKRFQSAELLLHAIERLQRTVFEPAGTTELKAWLAELAKKDGALPLSRRPDDPVAAPEVDRPVTEPIELKDADIVVSQPVVLPQPVVGPVPRPRRWPLVALVLAALAAAPLYAPLRERLAAGAPPVPVEAVEDAGGVIAAAVVPPAPELSAPELSAPPLVAAIPEVVDAGHPAPAPDAGSLAEEQVAAALTGPTDEQASEPLPGSADELGDAGELEQGAVGEPAAEVEHAEAVPSPPVAPAPRKVIPNPPPPKPAAAPDDQVSVLIESEPKGAQVRIGPRLFGNTPIPLRLRIGITFELVVSKSGYREKKVLHLVSKRANQRVHVDLVKGR